MHGKASDLQITDRDLSRWWALKSKKPKREPRKPFQAEWARLPLSWHNALWHSRSVATHNLARVILFEAFKRNYISGEIVLSAETTKMPRSVRRRAAKELVKLGLIKLHREGGNQAYRVTIII